MFEPVVNFCLATYTAAVLTHVMWAEERRSRLYGLLIADVGLPFLCVALYFFQPIYAKNIATWYILILFDISLLVSWYALNRQHKGVVIIGIGTLCNFIAIAVNHGFMPVSKTMYAYCSDRLIKDSLLGAESHYVWMGPNTHLWFLGDWLPDKACLFSIGDLIIFIGYVMATISLFRTLESKH